MEVGEPVGELSHHGGLEAIALQHRRQQIGLVELAHPHGIVDQGAAAQQPGGGRRPVDRADVQVEVGGQATIQPDFLPTEPAPPLERAEIDKAQIDRLLNLVGIGAGEQNPGDMGFKKDNPADGMAIGFRPQQGRDHHIHRIP